MNVAGLEVVNDAKLQSGEADGTETVERGTREETVVVVCAGRSRSSIRER